MAPADPEVPRTPVPPLPPGVANLRDFGREVMKWGRGDQARTRAKTLTREELLQRGVTLEIAQAWRDFYENETRRNLANQSATARAELMDRALTLLSEENE